MQRARRASDRTREEAQRELRRLVAALQERIPLRRILVFGSFARGDMHELSDIDLVIVGDFKGPPRRRGLAVRDVAWEIGLEIPIEVLAYTLEEFEAARAGAFLPHVLREAIEIPLG